jgi:cysteinyl-tRNA synthetase
MTLKIHNTLTRKKEEFKPIRPGEISMYVCGMTVYDFCHLGHARVLVAFDVITRFLRASGYGVTYVRNITDIDDKILVRAQQNNEPYTDLTKRFIDCMHEDERRLGVLEPDLEPRATGHIDHIIDMVRILIDKGFAYIANNGDVYYRVSKFEGYGKLSGKNPEELLSGARVEVDEIKEDPRDFALWKSAKEHEEAHWSSPWGAGRPGWHIECSAMSTCCLGDNFDIHGGGPDLPFPHHENEIAQSEAATGQQYANYWMHAGAVRVDGEKMSKSLGNFFTIRDILDQYHPEVVRYLLIASHYRSAINYSEDNLKEAKGALDRFYLGLKEFADVVPTTYADVIKTPHGEKFVNAMNDDFNTPVALSVLFDLIRDINSHSKDDNATARQLVADLKGLAQVLGVLQCDPQAFLQSAGAGDLSAEQIEALIEERNAAKKAKDFARADQVRNELLEKGVVLEDTRQGTTWRRE